MAASHVATITAFEDKFGTFTGVIRDEVTKEVTKERFATLDEARNFVRVRVGELFGKVKFAAMRRNVEYFANVWA